MLAVSVVDDVCWLLMRFTIAKSLCTQFNDHVLLRRRMNITSRSILPLPYTLNFRKCNKCSKISSLWLSLQALLPAVFRALYFIVYFTINRMMTNTIANIYLMITVWQNCAHPLICLIFVKPLRLTFWKMFEKIVRLLNINKSKSRLREVRIKITQPDTWLFEARNIIIRIPVLTPTFHHSQW